MAKRSHILTNSHQLQDGNNQRKKHRQAQLLVYMNHPAPIMRGPAANGAAGIEDIWRKSNAGHSVLAGSNRTRNAEG